MKTGTLLVLAVVAYLLLARPAAAAAVEEPGYRPLVPGDEGLAGILGALGSAIGGLLGTAVEPGGGTVVGGAVGGAAGAAAGYGGPQVVNAITDPYWQDQWGEGAADLTSGNVTGAFEHWSDNLANVLGVRQ